jgi:hypothetical protein
MKLMDNTGANNRYSLNLITTAVDNDHVCAYIEHSFLKINMEVEVDK